MDDSKIPEHIIHKVMDDPLIGLPGMGECWLSKIILDSKTAQKQFLDGVGYRNASITSIAARANGVQPPHPRAIHNAWCVRQDCPNRHINSSEGAICSTSILEEHKRCIARGLESDAGGHITSANVRAYAYTGRYGIRGSVGTHNAATLFVDLYGIRNEVANGQVRLFCSCNAGYGLCFNPRHWFVVPGNKAGEKRFLKVRHLGEVLASLEPIIPIPETTTNSPTQVPVRKETPTMTTNNNTSKSSGLVKVVTRAEYTLPVHGDGQLPLEALQELIEAVKHLPADTPVTIVPGAKGAVESLTIVEEA